MNRVYFSPTPHQKDPSLITRVEKLWKESELEQVIEKNDLTALKLHVGEPGNVTHVSPEIARALVGCIHCGGATPFLTDTAVLYKSPRDNGATHATVAATHGFGIDRVGASFIPADGLLGDDEVELDLGAHGTGAKHYKKVAIASAIVKARSMIVLTHLTGHLGAGLGGALKNLGMGCSSKKAKLSQHYGQIPVINEESCTVCGTCEDMCPSGAIRMGKNCAQIDSQKCIGCGECIAICRDGAVEFDWTIMGPELQERIVEHAFAVWKSKKNRIGYVTVAENITKDCDCLDLVQKPIVGDIGILASRDPVAIDRAVLDLVRQKSGSSLEKMTYPKLDASLQLRHAAKLGMGSGDYELITVAS